MGSLILCHAFSRLIFMPYYEFTIHIPSAFKEALIRRLSAAGCLGVIEQDEMVTAYFPETVDIKTLIHDLSLVKALLDASSGPGGLTFTHALIEEQDWNEAWKKGFSPIDVADNFTVLPPWEPLRKNRINIVIDPAMAFGTGHHETTRSCLELLNRYAPKVNKDRFLDLGTGTGILAIAAAKLGFRQVTGVDTDRLAVDAAIKNIDLNHSGGIDIREGSIADLSDSYDFIAANIISSVLVALAPQLASHLNPRGVTVVSGILSSQDDEVIEAMTHAGLKLIERYLDGKWISLVFER